MTKQENSEISLGSVSSLSNMSTAEGLKVEKPRRRLGLGNGLALGRFCVEEVENSISS